MEPINSENLKHTSARWYDSDDPTNRRICVNLHNGALTLTERSHPSHVWPPATKLILDASVDTVDIKKTTTCPSCGAKEVIVVGTRCIHCTGSA